MGRIADRLDRARARAARALRAPAGVEFPFDLVKLSGDLGYVSGHLPVDGAEVLVTGRVGDELDVEQGYEAARLVGLSIFASLERELGDLDRVTRLGQGARPGPVRAGLRQAARGDQRLHRPGARGLGPGGRAPRALGDRRRAAPVRRPGRGRGCRRDRLTSAGWSSGGGRRTSRSTHAVARAARAAGRRSPRSRPAVLRRARAGPRAADERVEERRRGQVGDRERVADQVLAAVASSSASSRSSAASDRRPRLAPRARRSRPGSAAGRRRSRTGAGRVGGRLRPARRAGGSIARASASIRSSIGRVSSCQAEQPDLRARAARRSSPRARAPGGARRGPSGYERRLGMARARAPR